MKTIIKTIDGISEWTGNIGLWFAVALVGVVSYEVIMRYVFRSPSLWAYEVDVMLGAGLYVLAFDYTLKNHAHVRVDVIYTHLPSKGKAIIDVLGDLLLFFPLIFLLTKTSATWVWEAWSTGDRLSQTGWYPPSAPIRAVIAIGFIVLFLQGVAQFFRNLHFLIKGKYYD